MICRFSRRKCLIGNSAEFKDDERLNWEPMNRFQKWDRMGKPRRLCDYPNTRKYQNILRCDVIKKHSDEYGEGHAYDRRRGDMSEKYVFLKLKALSDVTPRLHTESDGVML